MKSLLFVIIALVCTNVFAAPNCTVEEVRGKLLAKTGTVFYTIEAEFGIPMCVTAEEEEQNANETWNPSCVSAGNVMTAIYNLKWNEEIQAFMSPDYLNWQCAASTQCWAWIEATCDGDFVTYQDGEE